MALDSQNSAQRDRAEGFRRLHKPGEPLVLFNIWDAASARVVAKAGTPAIATSSAAVAVSHGYGDGEQLPRNLLVAAAARIAGAVDIPVSVDIETGYGAGARKLAETVDQIVHAGAVGVNIEDRIIGGALRAIAEQRARLAAAREAANRLDVPLLINARTDVFLQARSEERTSSLIDQVLERAAAYMTAGADSLFVPGLLDLNLIRRLCAASPLPLNIMVELGAPATKELAAADVARVSSGFSPMQLMLAWVGGQARDYFKSGVLSSPKQ